MKGLGRTAAFGLDLVAASLGRRRPVKLTFIVTDECSCRCAICNLWQAPRAGARTEEIARLFRANPYLAWINLSGGEVVEREDFEEIVAHAVAETRVAALDFPTAGQRPEEIERRVRSVLRLPLPRLFVSVSIDGPPALHDRLRGTEGAFERARETFRRLRAIGDRRCSAHIGVTLSSRNDQDPEALVTGILAAAPEIDRGSLHFNLAHHAPHYYRNRAGDRPDAGRAAAFLAREGERRRGGGAFGWLERAYWRLVPEYLATGRSPLPCSALQASAYVDPELRLYPCATWDRPLVDLREVEYSLERALALADARAAREEARTGRCPGCWTPCEAYPTLLSSLPRGAAALVAAGTRRSRAPRPLAEGEA